jgi:hypothetical protein
MRFSDTVRRELIRSAIRDLYRIRENIEKFVCNIDIRIESGTNSVNSERLEVRIEDSVIMESYSVSLEIGSSPRVMAQRLRESIISHRLKEDGEGSYLDCGMPGVRELVG